MSWSGLVKGAESFSDLKNIGNYFKSRKLWPYPLSYQITNKIKSENWNKNLSYSFKVIDKTNQNNSLGIPKGGNFKEFKLSINPLELTQEETFSINITPTQGGVISEHNGIIFRDLIIAGTTGVHPGRGSTGATSKGVAILNSGSYSGYEEFQALRNYFRAYAEWKKSKNQVARNSILIFINRKDNETLIVEPIKFSMKRSGARGPLYDYEIVLKVIGNFDYEEGLPAISALEAAAQWADDKLELMNNYFDIARGVLLKGSDLLSQLEREINNTIYEPFRQIDLMVKTLGGIATQLWHMPANIISNMNSSETIQFLKGMIALGDSAVDQYIPKNTQKAALLGGPFLLALPLEVIAKIPVNDNDLSDSSTTKYETEKQNVSSTPKSAVTSLMANAIRVRDNAAEAFGLGDTTYNAYADRSVTFTPSVTKQTTNQEIEILYGFNQLIAGLNVLLAFSSDIFKKDTTESFSETEKNFDNLISVPVPNSVSEIIIPPGATLEDIAFQYLGDFNRWTELAVLNNLIPPYIQETSTTIRIKQYGDRLLLPQNEISSPTNIMASEENIYNQNLTETEKRLGIDIKLNDSFDFVMNNRNDFELIVGAYNIGQAIRLKMNYEKGDLKFHPEVGIGLIIGEKNVDIDLIYDEITGTILQDPRFDSIKDFSLTLEGDSLVLKLNLLVAESSTPVPLSLNL